MNTHQHERSPPPGAFTQKPTSGAVNTERGKIGNSASDKDRFRTIRTRHPMTMNHSSSRRSLALALPVLLAGVLLASLTSMTCKESGTGPSGPDTTSHAFTWKVTTLGGTGGSSCLYDVAIINDTLAYAVGEIYVAGEADAYNVAKWDGHSWTRGRIPFIGSCSAVNYPPIRAIWAFSATDVLVTNGGSIVHYDGTDARMDCGMNQLLTGAINKICAQSSSNVYAVGNAGSIVHYDGTSWTKIESGTTLPMRGIWGNPGPSNDPTIQALAIASDGQDRRLISLNGTAARFLPDSGLSNFLYDIWFVPGTPYYIVGAGIHWKASLVDPVWQRYPSGEVTSYMSSRIRGSASNDIFVVGSFCEIVHYNGSTWHNYQDELALLNGVLGGVDVKGNRVIAVGSLGQEALIAVGRR